VKTFREEYGEPDIIKIHKMFPNNPKSCSDFEENYLTKIDAKNHPLFLNKHNGGKTFDTTGDIISPKKKQILSEKNSKEYICVSPEDEIFEIKNLSLFCKKYKLTESGMRCVANGRGLLHKNWQCFHKELYFGHKPSNQIILEKKIKLKEFVKSQKEKSYIITFPDGEIQKIKNLSTFCQNQNLNIGCMIAVAKGERKHHKQFKCKYL
jgi:hypothetical protein